MNIYVGNLNWSLTSDDLYNMFSPYGEVTSAKIVTDKFNNNRSKGFGFVEMSNDEAARKAISNLHDTEVSVERLWLTNLHPAKKVKVAAVATKRKTSAAAVVTIAAEVVAVAATIAGWRRWRWL